MVEMVADVSEVPNQLLDSHISHCTVEQSSSFSPTCTAVKTPITQSPLQHSNATQQGYTNSNEWNKLSKIFKGCFETAFQMSPPTLGMTFALSSSL